MMERAAIPIAERRGQIENKDSNHDDSDALEERDGGKLTPGRGYNREEVEAGAETINVYSSSSYKRKLDTSVSSASGMRPRAWTETGQWIEGPSPDYVPPRAMSPLAALVGSDWGGGGNSDVRRMTALSSSLSQRRDSLVNFPWYIFRLYRLHNVSFFFLPHNTGNYDSRALLAEANTVYTPLAANLLSCALLCSL